MLSGLITAVRTLTIFPVPGKDAVSLSSSLPWFPVTGAMLGFALYGTGILIISMAGEAAWPEGLAFILVIAGAVLTRGLHLDGLADWADGFASMTRRSRILEIMKDSRVGTFGVLALIAVLLAKWIAVARLVENGTIIWMVAAYVVSRTAQVELAATLPYARAEGGTGASFVNGARTSHRVGAWVLAIVMLAPLGPYGPLAIIPGFVVTKILGHWYRHTLGGVTGDLLGATSELVEASMLLLCALPGPWLGTYTGISLVF